MTTQFDTITADQLASITGGFVAPQPGEREALFNQCVANKRNVFTDQPLHGAALRSHCAKYVRSIKFGF